MNTSRLLGSLLLGVAAATAHAQTLKPASAVVSEPGRAAMAETVQATATVTAIDPATRKLTLKGPDGKTTSLVADERVRNFPQIKVGDKIVVEYARAISLELRKKGAPVADSGKVSGAARAAPGEKPAAAAAVRTVVVADVVAVDPQKKRITLRGPQGNVVELEVNNPDHFKVVKVGDQVEAEYVEAIAVRVEAAK